VISSLITHRSGCCVSVTAVNSCSSIVIAESAIVYAILVVHNYNHARLCILILVSTALADHGTQGQNFGGYNNDLSYDETLPVSYLFLLHCSIQAKGIWLSSCFCYLSNKKKAISAVYFKQVL
jgi:hypothetical protein